MQSIAHEYEHRYVLFHFVSVIFQYVVNPCDLFHNSLQGSNKIVTMPVK